MTNDNLSEKRYQLIDFGVDSNIYRYDEEDVREAVKKLKEDVLDRHHRQFTNKTEEGIEMSSVATYIKKLKKEIDKIFGEELSK